MGDKRVMCAVRQPLEPACRDGIVRPFKTCSADVIAWRENMMGESYWPVIEAGSPRTTNRQDPVERTRGHRDHIAAGRFAEIISGAKVGIKPGSKPEPAALATKTPSVDIPQKLQWIERFFGAIFGFF